MMKVKNVWSWWASIIPTWSFPSERKYAHECLSRPLLSDDEFFAKYYLWSGIRRDISVRIRRILAEQLGFDKIIPSDCPSKILQDIDIQTILDELADEFHVDLSMGDLPNSDDSFDSITWLVHSKIGGRKGPGPEKGT